MAEYAAASTPKAVSEEPSSNGGIETGKWSAGLCGCFSACVPNCLMATLCPCVSLAQIGTRVGFKYTTLLLVFGILVVLEYATYGIAGANARKTTMETSSSIDPELGLETITTFGVTKTHLSFWAYISSACAALVFIGVWQLRSKVRTKFELPGNCVTDCLVSFFCSCCAIAQMATHVKSYKKGSCSFGAPDELPAYNSQA